MRSVMRISIAMLAIAFAAIPVPWVSAEAVPFCNTSPVVAPGIGIGQLLLGVPLEDDTRVLGNPTDMDWSPDTPTRFLAKLQPTRTIKSIGWMLANYNGGPNKGFGLLAHNGFVVKINLIADPGTSLTGCTTTDGIHIGATPDVLNSWGQPTMVQQTWGAPGATLAAPYAGFWVYDSRGIYVEPYNNLTANTRLHLPNPSITELGIFQKEQFCTVTSLNPAKFTPPCP